MRYNCNFPSTNNNTKNHTTYLTSTNLVQVIELSQCPPEILVVSKNKSRGGDSFEGFVKQNIIKGVNSKSRNKYKKMAKLDIIDLQNGAYLFFSSLANKLCFNRKEFKKNFPETFKNGTNKKKIPSHANYSFELFLLSSNCNSMKFPPYHKLNERRIMKHVSQKLNREMCIPHKIDCYKLDKKMPQSKNDTKKKFQRYGKIFPKDISSKYFSPLKKMLPNNKIELMNKTLIPISMPNLHFIADPTSSGLFKFLPYYIKSVGMLKETKETVHETTYYYFYALFLSLINKKNVKKKENQEILVFSNSMNDISSMDIHSDYFLSLGYTMDRLISSLYTLKPFTNYNFITIILNGPELSLSETDLNCEKKVAGSEEEEKEKFCTKIAKHYSREKMYLLNDIYETIASRYNQVYMINISLLSRELSNTHRMALSNIPLLGSEIRDLIWKSILQIAFEVN